MGMNCKERKFVRGLVQQSVLMERTQKGGKLVGMDDSGSFSTFSCGFWNWPALCDVELNLRHVCLF